MVTHEDFKPGVSILLADTQLVMLSGLGHWLSDSTYRVVGQAGSTDAVVQMARELDPDIILLDLHLPGGLTARDMFAALKTMSARIIVFSADIRQYVVRFALSQGAAAYVSKSASFADLNRVISKVAFGSLEQIPQLVGHSGCGITRVEEQILQLMANGMKYDEIASVRNASPHTVRKQCERLQIKIGVPSRESLIVWAVNNGFGTG